MTPRGILNWFILFFILECLQFAARLRLNGTDEYKNERIEKCINDFRL